MKKIAALPRRSEFLFLVSALSMAAIAGSAKAEETPAPKEPEYYSTHLESKSASGFFEGRRPDDESNETNDRSPHPGTQAQICKVDFETSRAFKRAGFTITPFAANYDFFYPWARFNFIEPGVFPPYAPELSVGEISSNEEPVRKQKITYSRAEGSALGTLTLHKQYDFLTSLKGSIDHRDVVDATIEVSPDMKTFGNAHLVVKRRKKARTVSDYVADAKILLGRFTGAGRSAGQGVGVNDDIEAQLGAEEVIVDVRCSELEFQSHY